MCQLYLNEAEYNKNKNKDISWLLMENWKM